MLFASTSELVPKPGDEWGWWVGPRNESGRVHTPPFLRVTQKMCTWSEPLSNLLSFHCICLRVLINDLQVRKQRKAKEKQPLVSAPKSTPLAARRKFYPLDGTSLLGQNEPIPGDFLVIYGKLRENTQLLKNYGIFFSYFRRLFRSPPFPQATWRPGPRLRGQFLFYFPIGPAFPIAPLIPDFRTAGISVVLAQQG